MIKTILSLLIVFLALIPGVQPLTAVPYTVKSNMVKKEQAEAEAEAQRLAEEEAARLAAEEAARLEAEEDKLQIKLNRTIDLNGYCTVMIPSEYFEELKDQTTFTKSVIRYTDNKTKITMSYITNIGQDADIPGYITREAAGVDTITNAKYEKTFENSDNTWMVVPAENPVDGLNTTVYYLTNKSKTAAFWMKVMVHPDSDTEDFQQIIDAILQSINVYYQGDSVFSTPTTGWYADNPVEDDTLGDTSEYKANDNDENQVYQSDEGIVMNAGISNDWEDLQMIVDGELIQIPCKPQDIYDAGFKPNDKKIRNVEEASVLNQTTLDIINDNGTVLTITVINDDKTTAKLFNECTVISIYADTTKFLSVQDMDETIYHEDRDTGEEEGTTEENTEETMEESEEETTEESTEAETEDSGLWEDSADSGMGANEEISEESVEDKKKADKHEIIIAGGVSLGISNTNLLKMYGRHQLISTEQSGKYQIYTWKSDDGKKMQIKIGTVQNIQSIMITSQS